MRGPLLTALASRTAGGVAATPTEWIAGREAVPGRTPVMTPAGVSLDAKGQLWVVEDRNRTVLVLLPDTSQALRPAQAGSAEINPK